MRWVGVTVAFLILPLEMAVAESAQSQSAPYHIVLSRNAVSAGEQVELKLLPPVAPGVHVIWQGAVGSGEPISSATYRAPYVVPAEAPPATVSVGISGAGTKTIVSTQIALLPSSVPGAEDCLGPGQSFSTTAATIVPEFTAMDELPQLIHGVTPIYPPSDRARGIRDTIPVRALVCKTGRVLDAYSPPAYRLGESQPVPHDPKLVEAAIAAVREYVFAPAMKSAQAVATWIEIPVLVGP